MILIPNANIIHYYDHATPEQWQAWLAILRQYGEQTPDGSQVPWQDYNAVSAARKSGVFDPVAHPPPTMPAEPAATPQHAKAMGGVKSPPAQRRGCTGCGGAKYDPTEFNAPGGADALIQQIS